MKILVESSTGARVRHLQLSGFFITSVIMECVTDDSTRPKSTSHHKFYNSSTDLQVLFRVLKSILAKYSKFFSTSFDLTDRPDNSLNPLYDGVPVIVMPDSAAEIESLLYAPW